MQNIIERVKNLLALAKDGNSLNEALTAANIAQKMMREYNLTSEMLEEKNEVIDFADKYSKPWLSLLNTDQEIDLLVQVISEQNNCIVYKNKWQSGEQEHDGFSIIGKEIDIRAAEAIFWFLIGQLTSLTNMHSPEDRPSFWRGAICRLQDRFEYEKNIFKSVSLNENQIKTAIQRMDNNKSVIEEIYKSKNCRVEKDIESAMNEDFNLGYHSASVIEVRDRKKL